MQGTTLADPLLDSSAPAPLRGRVQTWLHDSDPEPSWSDERLVHGCLDGDERAWTALIDKYKNLIFSIPIRRGFSEADASDVFQSVVAELLSHIGSLRNPNAVAGWLIQVASHKCSRWHREQMREPVASETFEPVDEVNPTPEGLLEEAMREQVLREAICKATPRCRELIRMLFFENSARPYAEIAACLGIATGSIGFIRRRCLDLLRKYLVEAGLA